MIYGKIWKSNLFLTLVLASAMLTVFPSTASAQLIQVNSTSMTAGGDGKCTLREAILAANAVNHGTAPVSDCPGAATGLNRILLPAGTYKLTSFYEVFAGMNLGLPRVISWIEIVGDSAATTIIERDTAAGTPDLIIFRVDYTGSPIAARNGELTLNRVTVRNARSPSTRGSAVSSSNVVQVIDSVLSNNTANWGGAIYSWYLSVRGSTFENNTSIAKFGGAVFSEHTVIIENSLFVGNRVSGGGGAFGVTAGGTARVVNSTFKRNEAAGGAGGAGYGPTLDISDSWFQENRARDGGAIHGFTLKLKRSTVMDNTATSGGGGIALNATTGVSAAISDSTISGNEAGSSGGGISGTNLTLSNVTVSGNRSGHVGGGIATGGTFTANNITVTNNIANLPVGAGEWNTHGGGIHIGNGQSTFLANSIVANNVIRNVDRAPDCWSQFGIVSGGHNLIGNSCGCSITATTGDILGTREAPVDPLLGPLGPNGGMTLTHLPRAGSPVIDSASLLTPGSAPAACTVADQRGVLRPVDGDGDVAARGDRGSVELAGDAFPARPRFGLATFSADEPESPGLITISRSSGAGAASVQFATRAGTATDGADFTSVNMVLNFADGELSKTVQVPILDDTLTEGPESVRLDLWEAGAPPNTLPISTAVLFIKDDEAVTLVRTGSTSIKEGNSGTRDVIVRVDLTRLHPMAVNVLYQTEDLEAAAGEDYIAASGTLTIGQNSPGTHLIIKVKGDTVVEPDERFRVKLTTIIGCVGESRYVTVTILNDDERNQPPSIVFPGDKTSKEGDAVSLQIVTTDPNPGDVLTFSATGLPAGLKISSSGLIDGTIGANAAGTYTVVVTVSDGSLTDKTAFTWTVEALDQTPPVITPQVQGTLGLNGWYVSNVRVTWTVEDKESPVTQRQGCDSTDMTADTTGITLSCQATSRGGTASAQITIKRDATPPLITGSQSPAANSNGWNNTDVTVSFVCSDGMSGVDSCGPATQIVSSEGTGQSRTATASDKAGNAAAATVENINIDKTSPAITGMPAAAACSLWPPNHKMVIVGSVGASDSNSGLVGSSFTVTGTSNEPDNGLGDGDTAGDISITGVNPITIALRAERSGKGNGRIYTLVATAMDLAGNPTTLTSSCTVPHDQRK